MKNLEKEYKEAVSHEAPDLWSRIEAGVDAYEASKKEPVSETPVETHKDNIVKFDTKKFINIIGKISVAAVLLLVVAATFNMTRGVRKDAAQSATEAAATDFSNAEATQSDASEPQTNTTPAVIEESEAKAEQSEASESQVANDNSNNADGDFKDASPTLSPSEIPDAETASEIDSPSSDSGFVSDSDTAQAICKILDTDRITAAKLLKSLKAIGLTEVYDFDPVYENEVSTSSLGFETEYDYASVASFKAGPSSERYLLYYRIYSDLTILAVQRDDDTGEFVYVKPIK